MKNLKEKAEWRRDKTTSRRIASLGLLLRHGILNKAKDLNNLCQNIRKKSSFYGNPA